MTYPNRKLINVFRVFLILILIVNVLNGAVADNPRFSAISSWGPLWQGLFLTALISWAFLELVNHLFKKTRVGALPAYFWLITAGLNGADFLSNYSLLFEIANFDKMVHFTSGFFLGILLLNLAKRLNKNYNLNFSTFLFYFFAICVANVAGVIYEIGELIGDKYFGANNIIGPFDTTEDLVFNNLGLALLLISDWVIKKIRA